MCISTLVDAHTVSNHWIQQLERLLDFISGLRADEKDKQDVRQLIGEIKKFQHTNPINVNGQPIDVLVREELAALHFQVEWTITEKLGVKFENRERQINQLVSDEEHRREGLSSFWLIDAPARYGKTFFIFEVKRRLEALKEDHTEEPKWKVCYFSFKEYLGSAGDQKTFLTFFRRTFDRTSSPHWPGDPTINQMRDRLLGELGNEGKHLAIFIDDAELVTEKSMVEWIKRFLADIKRAHKATGKRFIGLVSGRYISPNWYNIHQAAPFPFDRIPMGSLGYLYTLDMVESISKKFGISNYGEKMEAKKATAGIVQMIGAGCPECTINLLIEMGQATVFNPNQASFPPDRHRELFKDHVKPVCDQVLEDVEEPLTKTYFPYLCVLRRYNRPLLKELMGFLQTQILPDAKGEAEPEQVLETLNRSGLIMIDITRAFQGDDNFRQLFGLQTWLFEKEKALQINDWAMRYFRKQITQNKGSNGIGYNREALIEYLYHYVMKLRNTEPTLTPQKAARQFTRTLSEALDRLEGFSPKRDVDKYEWKSHKESLLMILVDDVEIRDQMAHIGVDEMEYAQLCNMPWNSGGDNGNN